MGKENYLRVPITMPEDMFLYLEETSLKSKVSGGRKLANTTIVRACLRKCRYGPGSGCDRRKGRGTAERPDQTGLGKIWPVEGWASVIITGTHQSQVGKEGVEQHSGPFFRWAPG